jgi:hypothetical protein
MKYFLLFAGIATLLATTGCILVPEGGGRHEHARYEHRDAVVLGPPVVVVRAPELEVRPPEVIVR